MSDLNSNVKRRCHRSLKSVESFLKAQIALLRVSGKSRDVSSTIRKLKCCVDILRADGKDESKTVERLPVPKANDKGFPFLIGIVAQAAMSELFRSGMISDEDLRYLQSEQAQKDFVCRRVEFIRPYLTGAKSERLDKAGRDRYYFPKSILERKGCRFYLTKELTKGKLNNLLSWIYSHGITEGRLIGLCKAYIGGERKLGVRSDQKLGLQKCPTTEVLLPGLDEEPAVLLKADKLGAYVKNFFKWIEASGVSVPDSFIKCGLELKWCVRNLNLWRPLFATRATMTDSDLSGHRFWSKPFVFGNVTLFVNSQWYGKDRGVKQKRGFDQFAIELSNACGLTFSPYPLPGIAEERSLQNSQTRYDCIRESASADISGPSSETVMIHVTTMRKKTFRFKG